MTDSQTAYFNEIARVPLLTTDQEIQLGRQIQSMRALQAEGKPALSQTERRVIRNGKRALDRMVTSNLRLVVTIARKYYRGCEHLEMMDLIGFGNLGLTIAAEKFDPTRGYKFSTYAYWWIRQSITRGINDQDRTIRVPVHQFEKLSKIRRLRQQNPSLTLEEAAAAIGVSPSEIRMVIGVWSLASLDQQVVEDGEALVAMVQGTEQSPDDALLETMGNEDLDRLLSHLPKVDQQILKMRFGTDGQQPMKLHAIGKVIGVTRERVRQREKRALNRLRYLSQVGA